MDLQLERSISLIDLRKTQRRVTALISDSHPDLLRYPLRKNALPQTFCYVCSRIDPGGVFKNKNSYLYQKGFFHACEHFTHAPQPTFVGEEIKIDLDRKGREDVSTARETVALSFSVTIKHERDSGRLVTQSQKETTLGSSREPIKKEKAGPERSVKHNASRFLPALGVPSKGNGLSENKTNRKPKPLGLPELPIRSKTQSSIDPRTSDNKSRRSGLIKTVSSARESDKFSNYDADRITIIPTALDDDQMKSDFTTSPKSAENDRTVTRDDVTHGKNDVTTFVDGFTPSEGVATTTVGGATAEEFDETMPYINKSDGLGSVYSVEPLLKEAALLDDSRHGNAKHRNKARDRGRHGAEGAHMERPESGHFRYHHRNDVDSVPAPGFEIPPTPSIEERLLLEREERAKNEAERREIEQEIAMGNVFVEGSLDDDDRGDSSGDDASLRFTDHKSARSSQRAEPGPAMSSVSRASFCRCPSNTREASFMKSTCLICGKGIVYGNTRSSRSRDSSFTQNEAGVAQGSMRNPTSVSNRSRQEMLYQSRQRGPVLSNPVLSKSRGKKSVSDEDYMDMESIIHEDDRRYWSSEDDDHVTSHVIRSNRFRPFPLVDPNLHKMAYIGALREARLNSVSQGEDEFDVLHRLRHPHTFSYFSSLPGMDKENGDRNRIGLRPPDDTVNIKGGQFMRHIFGDVDMAKFYRKSIRRDRKHSLLDITDTALLPSDNVTREPSAGSPQALAKAPTEDERSSVSLKMRKSGVNFENGP